MSDDAKGKEYGDRRLLTLRTALVNLFGLDLLSKVAPSQRLKIGAGKTAIVVGGGFAGLASAYFLSALGFDVTVFEAKDRWGGRVWTNRNDFVPDRWIEFGAELIGWNHAVWRGLAEAFGLEFGMLTGDESLQRPWDLGELGVITGPAAGELDDAVDRVVDALALEAMRVPPYRPWDAPDAPALDGTSLGGWLDTHVQDKKVRAAVDVMFSNDNVGATGDQGMVGVLSQIAGGGCERFDPDTEVMRCADGNDALATQLAELNQAADLHLNTAISRVGVESDGARASVTLGREVSVGSPKSADYVVVAVPPSIYAGSASEQLVIDGIDPDDYRIALGPAVKHFARASARFWEDDGLGADGMSEPIGETWDATDSAARGPFDLSLFAGGPAAERARHARTQADPHADAFYAPHLKRLFPHYQPDATHMVSWPDESWIRCGYSCLAPGEMANAKRLTEPFENRIVFAGEHTCPAFYGYMEGALESGLLAADRILESMNWYTQNGKPHNAIREAFEAAARAGTQPDPDSSRR